MSSNPHLGYQLADFPLADDGRMRVFGVDNQELSGKQIDESGRRVRIERAISLLLIRFRLRGQVLDSLPPYPLGTFEQDMYINVPNIL